MEKPSVFLSSGQSSRDDSNLSERQTVLSVKTALEAEGFTVWTAFTKHDAKSLKELIFPQLADSDYFVFLDFKREPLSSDEHAICRGSLFSHQEFGIAAFLDLPIACFHEQGVEELMGIRGAIAANSTPFTDRRQLAATVVQEIRNRLKEGDWSLNSRNQLELSLANDTGVAALWNNQTKVAYYHINVRNAHHRKAATGCSAYLTEIKEVGSDSLPHNSAEFKWEGVDSSTVRINPGKSRGFDALLVISASPHVLLIKPFTDASTFIKEFKQSIKLELTFTVSSDQFPDSSLKVLADFDSNNGKLLLTPVA
jgi:hypothetical protein